MKLEDIEFRLPCELLKDPEWIAEASDDQIARQRERMAKYPDEMPGGTYRAIFIEHRDLELLLLDPMLEIQSLMRYLQAIGRRYGYEVEEWRHPSWFEPGRTFGTDAGFHPPEIIQAGTAQYMGRRAVHDPHLQGLQVIYRSDGPWERDDQFTKDLYYTSVFGQRPKKTHYLQPPKWDDEKQMMISPGPSIGEHLDEKFVGVEPEGKLDNSFVPPEES